MAHDQQAYDAWKRLHEQWHAANQKARTARGEVTLAFMKCNHGEGTGPTAEQLDNTDQLERQADYLRKQVDDHIAQVFR